MAKINTELEVIKINPIDNPRSMPQIIYQVTNRSMIADEIDILTVKNLNLKEFKLNKLYYWVNKTAGGGTPELTVSFYNVDGLFRFTVTPGSSPYEFPGLIISIQIEETATAVCTYNALAKVI